MSTTSTQIVKPANGFVRCMRRVYNPLGFSKGYNAALGSYPPLLYPMSSLLINAI